MGQPTNDGQLDPGAVIVVGPALTVQPGDRLIVGVAGPLNLQQADQIKAHLREKLPGLADVVLITQVTQMAVYRDRDGS